MTTLTEPKTLSEQTSDLSEKMEKYRSGNGTVYRDVNDMMSAKLTQDTDGYHLALSFSPEYNSEEINWFVTFKDFGDTETSFILTEDGVQIESDIITVHGCLECLRILDVSQDGSRAWDLSLYPVDGIPDGIEIDKNLSLFDGTLDNYDGKENFYEMEMPDFLDEEQQHLFANAEYLWVNSICTMFSCKSDDEFIMTDDFAGKAYGIDYGSFVDYVETVFTQKYSAEFLNNMSMIKNVGGEIYDVGLGRDSNILYTGRTFELISKSDSEIKFKLIAHYSYKGHIEDDEYNSMPDNEREYDEKYLFSMVNTPNGWRFDEFEFWL